MRAERRSGVEQAFAEGQSRDHVAAQILASPEARGLMIADAYQALLERPADTTGADDWRRFLDQGHSVEEFLRAVLTSDEYYRKNDLSRLGIL